ncbi:MAG TPA: hypothetical protein VGJ85_03000, partial [Candidatus Nanopelagicaceae bacterium]
LAGENISQKFIGPTVASAIDIVVQMSLDADGRRRIIEVSSLTGRMENDHIEIETLWLWDKGKYERGLGSLPHPEKFSRLALSTACKAEA